ncbi:hypothetical protein EYR40_008276 [Pleurotus pulmonarius]|nr:hypothetical protein EYR40_008276 [Pleurotus pulmonarius]
MLNPVTLLLARCFVFGGVVAISLVVIEVEGYATNVIANVEGAVISRIGLITSQLTLVSLSAMAFSSAGSFLNTILFEIIWLVMFYIVLLSVFASRFIEYQHRGLREAKERRDCKQLAPFFFSLTSSFGSYSLGALAHYGSRRVEYPGIVHEAPWIEGMLPTRG